MVVIALFKPPEFPLVLWSDFFSVARVFPSIMTTDQLCLLWPAFVYVQFLNLSGVCMNSLGFFYPNTLYNSYCDSKGILNPLVGTVEELMVYLKGFQHLKKHFAFTALTDLVQVLEKGKALHTPGHFLPGPSPGHICAPWWILHFLAWLRQEA